MYKYYKHSSKEKHSENSDCIFNLLVTRNQTISYIRNIIKLNNNSKRKHSENSDYICENIVNNLV